MRVRLVTWRSSVWQSPSGARPLTEVRSLLQRGRLLHPGNLPIVRWQLCAICGVCVARLRCCQMSLTWCRKVTLRLCEQVQEVQAAVASDIETSERQIRALDTTGGMPGAHSLRCNAMASLLISRYFKSIGWCSCLFRYMPACVLRMHSILPYVVAMTRAP